MAQNILSFVPKHPDKTKSYIFYLHGRIVEIGGERAKSEQYGYYEYKKILKALRDSGSVVISEARKGNIVPTKYAIKVKSQIDSLLSYGIPPENITVIGASKGAGIAVLLSNLLKNTRMNFVLLAICNERMGLYWKKNNIKLWGRVLHIYDYNDSIAGSCKNIIQSLKSKGLTEFKEIETKTGLGHGLLFKPLKDWLSPAIQWSKGRNE